MGKKRKKKNNFFAEESLRRIISRLIFESAYATRSLGTGREREGFVAELWDRG